MRLYKSREKSKAICEECGGVRPTTFRVRSVLLSSKTASVPDVLAGVCDTCDSVVSIPQQSVPKVREAIGLTRKSLEARIPQHLSDAMSLVCVELGLERYRPYDEGQDERSSSGQNYLSESGDRNRRDFSRDSDRDFGSSSRESGYGQTSHAGKGPKGWQRSDENIREQVCDALERDHRVDASEIEVTVSDGIVTLSGTVESRQAKRQAEDILENLSGVKDVRNELSLASGGTSRQNSDTDADEEESTSSRTSSKASKKQTKQKLRH